MNQENILNIKSKEEFYGWLKENYDNTNECFLELKKGKPENNNIFYYLDAVEVALCFGWIDSTNVLFEGKRYIRFSKRSKNSPWTELNKERVRRLEKLGLMTDAGREVLPPMGEKSFKFDQDVVNELKKARVWSKFKKFPKLYQRIRVYNVHFYKDWNREQYKKSLSHLINETKKGRMYGERNDYGRLINY